MRNATLGDKIDAFTHFLLNIYIMECSDFFDTCQIFM